MKEESREQREQMKALSMEIFGKSSRYQKFYEQEELVTRTAVETVPGENGAADTNKEVNIPVLSANGTKQYRIKYRTADEVLQLLQEFKAKRDAFIEQMKAQQEAEKVKKEAEELAKKVQEDLSGSALT